MLSFSRLAIVGLLASVTTPAFALFDAQVMVGKRWYEQEVAGETHGLQAQQISVAAHVDPLPVIPIAVGVGINNMMLNTKDLGEDIDSASVFEAGVEVMAWIPMVPVITPYGRLHVPVTGKYVVKGKIEAAGASADYAETATVSGYHLNVGAKYAPLPLVKLLFEVGMSTQKFKPDEVKVGGTVQPKGDETDLKSKTFLIGVEVGL